MANCRHFTKAAAGAVMAAAVMLATPSTAADEGAGGAGTVETTDGTAGGTRLAERKALPNTPYRAMGGLRETRKREQAIREAFERPRGDLDCTFFASQAFNKEPGHFAARMAAMCRMLSDYKEAVIETNRARYRAESDGSQAARAGRPERERMIPMPDGTDTGKYLLAREIGLIDALGN